MRCPTLPKPRIRAVEPAEHPRNKWRLFFGNQGYAFQKVLQLLGDDTAVVGLVQNLPGTLLFRRVHIVFYSFLELQERVQLILTRAQTPFTAQKVECQIHDDEYGINNTYAGSEEIIVVARNELAYFVDKKAESDAADKCCQTLYP